MTGQIHTLTSPVDDNRYLLATAFSERLAPVLPIGVASQSVGQVSVSDVGTITESDSFSAGLMLLLTEDDESETRENPYSVIDPAHQDYAKDQLMYADNKQVLDRGRIAENSVKDTETTESFIASTSTNVNVYMSLYDLIDNTTCNDQLLYAVPK